jgi:hypothetical protein
MATTEHHPAQGVLQITRGTEVVSEAFDHKHKELDITRVQRSPPQLSFKRENALPQIHI